MREERQIARAIERDRGGYEIYLTDGTLLGALPLKELARLRARAELVGELVEYTDHGICCTFCSCGLDALLARVEESQSDSESQAAQPPTRSPAKPK